MSRATTAEQRSLVDETRTFLAGIDPMAASEDLDDRFAALVAYEQKLHAAGLAVVSWPERYGGRGLGPVEAAIVSEELGLGGAPETINFIALEVVAPALFRFASAEQLDRWLPPMPGADEVWCQLFSEPDAGSDLASLATRAVRDGSEWVVNGQKVWSTWGQYSQKALLLARTGTPESRHKGIAAFVMDVDTPGVEVRPLRTMTGEAEFAEVFLSDVRIPDADMVGSETDGWGVAMEMLAGERGPYAVRRASVVRATLEGVYAAVRERQVDPLTRDEITRAAIDLHVLDRQIDRVVDALAAGDSMGPAAAMTKALLTRADQSVHAVAQKVLGPAGVAWSSGMPAWTDAFLYSRASSIYGGTSEIQRNIIAERLLGLPREPT